MIQSLKKISQGVNHDWFSDAVTSGLESVGVTRDIRNTLQPTVDRLTPVVTKAATNVLFNPSTTPPATAGVAAIPQTTGFPYSGYFSPAVVVLGLVGIVGLYYLTKGK